MCSNSENKDQHGKKYICGDKDFFTSHEDMKHDVKQNPVLNLICTYLCVLVVFLNTSKTIFDHQSFGKKKYVISNAMLRNVKL